MNSILKPSGVMAPISGRIPDELYQWLSTTPLEGATTVSDKLRVAVASLKRTHDGDADYQGALAMHRDLTGNTRRQVAALEPELGHSEVLAAVFEHVPALAAALGSAQVHSLADARKLEATLAQRSLLLAESLLRQALTRHARAYDPAVVRANSTGLIELAKLLPDAPAATQ